ncbi:hypothetical protein B0H19DRAFT_1200847 [Mycena capillaripes]|nr:hypothetical protein B0H19DRAFT_1200847 [Mycena capillaripes]
MSASATQESTKTNNPPPMPITHRANPFSVAMTRFHAFWICRQYFHLRQGGIATSGQGLRELPGRFITADDSIRCISHESF